MAQQKTTSKSKAGKAKKRATPSEKKTVKRTSAAARRRMSARSSIDTVAKGIVLAAEPPINADPANLDAPFRGKLNAALADLSAQGKPFKLVEGFRTTDRQQWLYGSGRPS